MRVAFTVLGVPAPQGSFRAITHRYTGRVMLKQDNKRTMPWRKEVAGVAVEAVKAAGLAKPMTGPLEMSVVFWLPRPKGHFGKKGLRPSAPRFPSKKPDLSKLLRAAEDALTGIVYDDDARIVRHLTFKEYANEVHGPSMTMAVEELDDTIGGGT